MKANGTVWAESSSRGNRRKSASRARYTKRAAWCASTPRCRGQITFPNFDGQADWYVWLFLAQHWTGQLRESPEGSLAWIDNDRLLDLNLWPGDRLFIPWMFEDRYFSAKFLYHDGDFQGYEATFYSPGGASTARVTSIRQRSPRPISSLSTSRLTTPTAGCATAR